MSKGDAPCFCCAQGNPILWSKELLPVRTFSQQSCPVPLLGCSRAALNSSQKEKGAPGGIIFYWVPRARNCLGPEDSLEELHRAGISYRNKPKPLEALTYKIVIFVVT